MPSSYVSSDLTALAAWDLDPERDAVLRHYNANIQSRTEAMCDLFSRWGGMSPIHTLIFLEHQLLLRQQLRQAAVLVHVYQYIAATNELLVDV
jgi:hypothetical protein